MVKKRVKSYQGQYYMAENITAPDDIFDQGVWFNGCGKYFFQAKEPV
jgi:hypothetical protein